MRGRSGRGLQLTQAVAIVTIYRYASALGLAGALLSTGEMPARGEDAFETYGDIMQFALSLTALGTTFFVGDTLGRRWDRESRWSP